VTDGPARVIALAREHGLGAGIACNPGTPVADAARAAEGADLALCMSIWPGYSGQDFMTDALPRIRELRSLLPDDVHLQVDGGVGEGNIAEIRAAGANLFVAGSAIFASADPADAYRRLVEAVS
jgi:ribulose-phosphate 3-epimerase